MHPYTHTRTRSVHNRAINGHHAIQRERARPNQTLPDPAGRGGAAAAARANGGGDLQRAEKREKIVGLKRLFRDCWVEDICEYDCA